MMWNVEEGGPNMTMETLETLQSDVRSLRDDVRRLARCVADLADLAGKVLEDGTRQAAEDIAAEAAALE